MKTGRNDPCPCGSGRKYKQCCLAKDEMSRAEAAEAAAFAHDEVVEMLLRQTGFTQKGELDAAMKRFELYCENLPESANAPTFMEFLGKTNPATELQREIRAEVEGRRFSSKEELDRFLAKHTDARGRKPMDDFEGLSPEQMNRLLNKEVDAIPDIVELAEHVPDELALEAEIVRTTRWILGYLAEHGGEIRLTDRGNFPRTMCTRYLEDRVDWWRPGEPVPSEQHIPGLVTAHEFALEFGYLDGSRTKTWITTEGAGVYASGRWGEAYPQMIRTAIDELAWQEELDESLHHEHFEIVQHAAVFVLRLLHHHPTGTSAELFDRFATAFPLYAQPGQSDPGSMRLLRDVFVMLVIHIFCKPFGLLTSDYVGPDEEGGAVYSYETTPLFGEAFRWKG